MVVAKQLNQDQVIALLRKRQGLRTAKELAAEIGISQQYLSDVYAGKRTIGPAILEELGLESETVYIPAKDVAEANG